MFMEMQEIVFIRMECLSGICSINWINLGDQTTKEL